MSHEPDLSLCEAVLFDAAGTLIRAHPSVGAVYAAAVAEHGWRACADALQEAFRLAWRQRVPLRFAGGPACRTSDALDRAWWRETVALNFRLAGLPEPHDACFETIFARFGEAASWRLFGDALPALRAVRDAGRRAVIVSNFDSRLLRICDGLGLSPAVDAIVYSAAVGHAKPARAIFDAAAAAAGTVPGRCLVVGDSPNSDVAGGRAAGCHALLLDRRGRRSGPHVIRALTEIPRLLGGGCP